MRPNFHFKMAFKSDRKILSDSVSKESNVQMFHMYIFHKLHIVDIVDIFDIWLW